MADMTKKPLQNRIDPWGRLNAVPQRGTLMGNRGTLHDEHKRIVRQWKRKAWVTCLLSYDDTKRIPFSPGNYSELFFLDEATAFAAGHRPCNTCQRERHAEFKSAWLKANRPTSIDAFVKVSEIDDALHSERMVPEGVKRTHETALAELPAGTIFAHQGAAFLVWKQGLLKWTFDGYSTAKAISPDTVVTVLTPKSIFQMYKLGFLPQVHASANA
jgi:hypothetical protein